MDPQKVFGEVSFTMPWYWVFATRVFGKREAHISPDGVLRLRRFRGRVVVDGFSPPRILGAASSWPFAWDEFPVKALAKAERGEK